MSSVLVSLSLRIDGRAEGLHIYYQPRVRTVKIGQAAKDFPTVCVWLFFHYLRLCSFVGKGITEVREIMFHSTARFEEQDCLPEGDLGQPWKAAGTGPSAWDYSQEGKSPGTSLDQDHLGLAGALVHCPPHPSTRYRWGASGSSDSSSATKISQLIEKFRFRKYLSSLRAPDSLLPQFSCV